jgi:hypothetical protein
MKQRIARALALLFLVARGACAGGLENDRYKLVRGDDGALTVTVAGMAPQRLVPEFTVLRSEADPHIERNFTHPNYLVAPRPAVRWYGVDEPVDVLNAWLASPQMKAAIGFDAIVREEAEGRRAWEYRNASGKLKLMVTGRHAGGTTRPFSAGQKTVLRPVGASLADNRIRWQFAGQATFALAAELQLPSGQADPQITFELTPTRNGFYSVGFTGAPDAPLDCLVRVPQPCAGSNGRQFDFVLCEADLKLPSVQISTAEGSVAVVADPCECRFRLPTLADSRFGLMLAQQAGRLRPVLWAPLLGGAESQRKAGQSWRFSLRIVVRPGGWQDAYRHIARAIHGFRDQRDASGPGSLNGCLDRVMDFLADRNGRNYAMWHDEQKYYDYFTDQTGVFKPFSPLTGLSAAIVTDDEDFYRRRARPAVEFALSRKYNVFSPYEAKHRVVSSAARDVGGPYIGYAQLVSLHEFLQRRVPVLRKLAEERGPAHGSVADALARWQLTGDRAALDEAVRTARAALAHDQASGVQGLFDYIDLHAATREPQFLRGALDAAYHYSTSLNLYPAPPDESVTVDAGGRAPIHYHSFGRHHNVWGFFTPQPVATPEQVVPAWRVARLGLPSPAYPMEYWMNVHGALLRVAALGGDTFLRDIARWAVVGRFGNYPGDNRSQISLIGERPDAVEHPPWQWNFATVNPGHAWDFAGAVLDFLVSDAFYRSGGAIDFPAESLAGCDFRVRAYGARPGRFYDARDVRLWLPRGLVRCDNRQLDWLAGYGNGQFYLALWNQSSHEERGSVMLDRAWVECRDGNARSWVENRVAAPLPIADNAFSVAVGPKGIVALAIPATVKPRLQAKLYAVDTRPLPDASFQRCPTSFGMVHAMLLTAGRGLASAFVYAEALPEDVIAARLRWRQGPGAWHEMTDAIYPYEFSPELADGAGDFECVFEVENSRQQVERSGLVRLEFPGPVGPASPAAVAVAQPVDPAAAPRPAVPHPVAISAEFLDYLKMAANPKHYGLHDDGRFYPYSTPQGRRIAWRLPVWDKGFYAAGCTAKEAEERLRGDVSQAAADLAARPVPVAFERLAPEQKEILLDMALSEGAANLHADLLAAVLARDWNGVVQRHLYIRYAGPAPDHARNKAFAERWIYSGRLGK